MRLGRLHPAPPLPQLVLVPSPGVGYPIAAALAYIRDRDRGPGIGGAIGWSRHRAVA